MQGLAWFSRALRQDSDGCCAHAFLEEPCRQQVHRRQQPERQEQRDAGGCGGTSASPEGRPAAKQQKGAPLQDSSRRAKQLVGRSDMIVDRGNVYVVPAQE